MVFDQMNEVQSQASTTATEALVDVSRGLWVMQILGHASEGALDRLEIYVKLQPGSSELPMEEVLTLFICDETCMQLRFDEAKADSTTFGCDLVLAASDVADEWPSLHVLGTKDIAKITITDDDGDLDIGSMEHVTMTFMPASGLGLGYGFSIPQMTQDGWFTIR